MPVSYVNGAPPQQTPFTDERNRITVPWFSYLATLQRSNSGVVIGDGGLDLNGQTITGSATFAGAIAFAGAVAFAVAPTFGNPAGTRSALGLGSAATQASSAFEPAGAVANLLASANTWNGATQTINSDVTIWGQLTLGFALNWAGAQVFGTAKFSNDMLFPYSNGFWYASPNAVSWYEFRSITSQGAALANDYFGYQYNQRATVGGADAWQDAFQIAALTGLVTFFSGVKLSSALNLNGQAISGSTAGSLNIGRAPTFATAAVIWGVNVTNASAGDNLVLGQSSATYSTGPIAWIGNSAAFLYFNSGQDFKIGAGVGATPAVVVKGSNRNILIGTATDNGTDKLQVSGGAAFSAAVTFTTPASIAFGSGWINWTPTVTASGSMTVSALSITDAQYLRVGPLVFFKLFASFTLGGTASTTVIFTLPVAMAGGQVSTYSLQVHGSGATWAPGYGLLDNTNNTGRAANINEAAYMLGAGVLILAEGFYRCA